MKVIFQDIPSSSVIAIPNSPYPLHFPKHHWLRKLLVSHTTHGPCRSVFGLRTIVPMPLQSGLVSAYIARDSHREAVSPIRCSREGMGGEPGAVGGMDRASAPRHSPVQHVVPGFRH